MPSTRSYALGASALVAVGLSAGAWLALGPGNDDPYAPCRPGAVAIGGPTLGGPFELVDHAGSPRTSAQIIDKPTLIYFGYTYCPDICPTSLLTLSQGLQLFAEQDPEAASQVVPVPISCFIRPNWHWMKTCASKSCARCMRCVLVTLHLQNVVSINCGVFKARGCVKPTN